MKLLLYCTKAKPYLYGMYAGFDSRYGYHITNDKNVYNQHNVLNGKIVAECDFEVEEIPFDCAFGYFKMTNSKLEKSCLSLYELNEYLKGKNGYAIHIKNLHIFDEPKELSEYYTHIVSACDKGIYLKKEIKNAPQNMMYAYDNDGNKYIVISIQPQWMCLILNRIKYVEVRRVVLKEMLMHA